MEPLDTDGWLSGLKRNPAKIECENIASRVQIPDHPYKPKDQM